MTGFSSGLELFSFPRTCSWQAIVGTLSPCAYTLKILLWMWQDFAAAQIRFNWRWAGLAGEGSKVILDARSALYRVGIALKNREEKFNVQLLKVCVEMERKSITSTACYRATEVLKYSDPQPLFLESVGNYFTTVLSVKREVNSSYWVMSPVIGVYTTEIADPGPRPPKPKNEIANPHPKKSKPRKRKPKNWLQRIRKNR